MFVSPATRAGRGRLNLNRISGSAPAFEVVLTTPQTVATPTNRTRINFDTVVGDTAGYWDPVNFRYTPLLPGYYLFNAQMEMVATTSIGLGECDLEKNGVLDRISTLFPSSSASARALAAPRIVAMNGVTDFMEVYGVVTASSGTVTFRGFTSTFFYCYFNGTWLRPL